MPSGRLDTFVMFSAAASVKRVTFFLWQTEHPRADVSSALQIQGQRCHPLPHPEGDK